MKKIKVAINGFGRIGRQFFKVAYDTEHIDIIAINDLSSLKDLAYLLEFDIVYGRYDKSVEAKGAELILEGKVVK